MIRRQTVAAFVRCRVRTKHRQQGRRGCELVHEATEQVKGLRESRGEAHAWHRVGKNSEIIDDFWKWANWYHVIMRLEDCEDVSIEQRGALNKLQIFHRCLCYKNTRYK